MSDALQPVDLSEDEVRAIRAGRRVVRYEPVPIDDTPITEESWRVYRRQRGIPSNAQNVRFIGFLKCDSPEGSVTVSSRMDPPVPLGAGDVLWVREAFAEYEPDDVQGTRVYYAADYEGRECWVRPGVALMWRPSSEMQREFARCFVNVHCLGVEFRDGAWQWVLAYDCAAAL